MSSLALSARCSAILALAALAAACASQPAIVNNPMTGDVISVAVGQALTVKLTDTYGEKTDWVMTAEPSSALTAQGHRIKPAEGGALPLDIYEFVGAAPGQQTLTFAYRQPGEPATPDNTITVTVSVKG